MFQSLRSMSVAWKLLIPVATVVALGFATLVWESSQGLHHGLYEVAKLNRIDTTELLAENVKGGVRWKKSQAIEAAYTQLVAKPDSTVSDLVTWDAKGNVLTRYRAKQLPEYPLDSALSSVGKELRYEESGTHAWLVVPITSGKEGDSPVGTLAIAFSNDRLSAVVNDEWFDALVISLLALVVALALIVWVARSVIGRPLCRLKLLASELAEGDGDLTRRLEVSTKDEFGRVAVSINLFIAKIQDVVTHVTSSATQLDGSAQQVNEISLATNELLAKHQTEVEQVATAMNQMSVSFAEVSGNASNTANAANEAKQGTSQANDAVGEAVAVIDRLATEVESATNVVQRLEEDSERIGGVLDVIRGIAEQTNLLALNAAIEAARAGEQGRGFAVVADEVRTLASRTQESTQEIQQMIEQVQQGSRNAVAAMQKSRDGTRDSVDKTSVVRNSLEAIMKAVAAIADMNLQVANAVEEQTSVSDDISESISSISALASGVVERSQQNSQASSGLTELSSELKRLLGQFRT